MPSIDPRIRITAGVVMALISYVVAVYNFADNDIRSGIILTIIGIFFTTVALQTTRRFLEHDR
ncbi:hypothetical protein [Rhodococcus sp. P1Y]|uniref:hypothetical protein n=1 Tax=Rhodococcus sp. P1Y TaxID=1302308 RepID=UPI0012940D3E|nr:hypothetical protein [Rhodococcus sp. P1Y]